MSHAMKRMLSILAVILLAGCRNTTILTSVEEGFSFTAMNVLTYEVTFDADDVLYVQGDDIMRTDVTIAEGILTVGTEYLASLDPGDHEFVVRTVDETLHRFRIVVLDEHNRHRIINGGFETGDLMGWTSQTTFKREQGILSFTDANIVSADGLDGDGSWSLGRREDDDGALAGERLGMLRSSIFELAGSGWITFSLGGGNPYLNYVSVRHATTHVEIARFANLAALPGGRLTPYRADLSQHVGEPLYLELVDNGAQSTDTLFADSFETYHETSPENGTIAVDMTPSFDDVFVPNQLFNGDFRLGLDGYDTVSFGSGETFHVEDEILKSNLGGDDARGLLRSSLFRVDGSGWIKIDLGAAQGARYDKDTYVSIRRQDTNEEIFRFANRNADGTAPVSYYIDLSSFAGDHLYLEIVDNAGDAWDTIFVYDITTYFATAPVVTYDTLGVNLNE